MDTVIWNFVNCVDDDEWICNQHAVGIGWRHELVRGKKMKGWQCV